MGTHIDSLSHCFPNSNTVADIAKEIIYDAIIFDFVQFCKINYTITLDMILEKMPNDISLNNTFIIIKTVWGIKWGTKEYFNNYLCSHCLLN
ncbi:MAG: cyclase family protein [Nanoarchaeota archaeon]|nr:cyclase family protein [Nanoarchaeota archaeon]